MFGILYWLFAGINKIKTSVEDDNMRLEATRKAKENGEDFYYDAKFRSYYKGERAIQTTHNGHDVILSLDREGVVLRDFTQEREDVHHQKEIEWRDMVRKVRNEAIEKGCPYFALNCQFDIHIMSRLYISVDGKEMKAIDRTPYGYMLGKYPVVNVNRCIGYRENKPYMYLSPDNPGIPSEYKHPITPKELEEVWLKYPFLDHYFYKGELTEFVLS